MSWYFLAPDDYEDAYFRYSTSTLLYTGVIIPHILTTNVGYAQKPALFISADLTLTY